MKVVNMKAERRTALGRNQVKQLRATGWLPAVVYGEGKEAQSISISEWELERHVKAHHKVFQIDISGTTQSALLQEVSWQATTDRPLHVDFKRIDLTKPIETEVEVTLLGFPVGLGKGGALNKDHVVLTVRCLPTAIPEVLEYDISGLDLDEVLQAGQIPMPEGVTLVTPPTTSVCHVALAVVVQAPAAVEEPAAEAAEAPAAAPAKGAAPAKAPPKSPPAKG